MFFDIFRSLFENIITDLLKKEGEEIFFDKNIEKIFDIIEINGDIKCKN